MMQILVMLLLSVHGMFATRQQVADNNFHFGYNNLRFGYFRKKQAVQFCSSNKLKKMKTIFITGASTGLGKATAKLFASKGWRVIATMRKPENERELNLIDNISMLPLDVTNLTQIHETIQKAITISDIDVVFNNAGYGLIGPLESTTDDQLVRQLETNILGVI